MEGKKKRRRATRTAVVEYDREADAGHTPQFEPLDLAYYEEQRPPHYQRYSAR
ncbi:hypothetical protein [Corynebacterium liangguodongii]|uniref:hypothetical protein n=1 Tax=Corynebacterium liangguodongii TaxID=2079535 RepID=UPI0013048E7F|nr:hypothetical protein [Corynebacterium liangguodongii]